MAVDVISVWNMAVSACGNKADISTEDENTKAANLCRLWYPLVRDNVIKAGDWPSARKHDYLALKATRDETKTWTKSDPAPGWKFAYAQPSDMLAPRHLHSYSRFERSWLDDANTIVTNQEQAILHYMFQQKDVTKWDADLEQAIVLNLAHAICQQLTGTRSLTESLQGRAQEALLRGQTATANENDQIVEGEVSWFNSRGFSDHSSDTKFIWPYDTFNITAA